MNETEITYVFYLMHPSIHVHFACARKIKVATSHGLDATIIIVVIITIITNTIIDSNVVFVLAVVLLDLPPWTLSPQAGPKPCAANG